MALSLSVGCRNGLANTQGFREMFTGGTLKIFTGNSPGVEYGATGSELISITVANLSSAGTGGVYIRQAGTIISTGTAGYFRLSNADDTPTVNADGTAVRIDGVCGVSSLTSDLIFSGLAMTAGKSFTVTGTFRIP